MGVQPLKQAVAGKWQIPLFVLAFGMLASGLWQLRPQKPVLTFDEALEYAVVLRTGEMFEDSLRLLDDVESAEERTPAELARIARVRAETLYYHQRQASRRSPTAVRQILDSYDQAVAGGVPLEPDDHLRIARANDWLDRVPVALRAYRQALRAGVTQPLAVRRRIIELMTRLPQTPPDEIHAALDELVQAAADSPDNLLWAVQQKVSLWAAEGRNEESLQLLERVGPPLARTAVRDAIDYLHALTLVRLGSERYDEAERELRALRDRIGLTDALNARTGWLLGEINLRDDRPQAALPFFEDVLRTHGPGEYRTASLLGEAIALARLERFDESLLRFEQLIATLPEFAASEVVNPAMVRLALTSLAESLKPHQANQNTAVRFMGLARMLTRPEDAALQTQYTAAMASIYVALARSKRALAEALADSTDAEEQAERNELLRDMTRHFVAAGEEYDRLADLLTLSESASADAAWMAIQMYDEAGLTERHIVALRDFIAERPEHVRIPEARHRLGRAYHLMGAYESAVAQYQENVRENPRAMAALRSRVELGAVYIAMGESHFPDAERVLLELIDEPAGYELITPAAEEYKDALFLLADLYERRGEYEKAVVRLDEFLNRYPQDPRSIRARFLLAEAYRRSAEAALVDMQQAANAVHRDQLEQWRRSRLQQAADLYGRTIASLDDKPDPLHTPTDKTYLRLSHFAQADCYFDLAQYERALSLYEDAALKYESEPISLSGFVQMIRCHDRLGNFAAARQAIRRARVLTKKIPDEAFAREQALLGDPATTRDRAQWEAYFDWLAGATLFADAGSAATGT